MIEIAYFYRKVSEMKDWRMRIDEGRPDDRKGMNDTGDEASQLPDDGMNGDDWSRENGDGRMNKPEGIK